MKGLAAAHIVRAGGEILLAAACAVGLVGPEFGDLVRQPGDAGKLLDSLADRSVEVVHWQAEELAMVAQKASLSFFVPGLDETDRNGPRARPTPMPKKQSMATCRAFRRLRRWS